MIETKKHRKIFVENYGLIPEGYDIHHIDGNHDNNDPINLKAVSLQEHFDIHYSQGDYAAANRIAQRMGMSKEERSKICSLAAIKANNEGRCGFKLGHASQAGKVGGKKGGKYAKEDRTGIFALSPEQDRLRIQNMQTTWAIKLSKASAWPRTDYETI